MAVSTDHEHNRDPIEAIATLGSTRSVSDYQMPEPRNLPYESSHD
jgi:hypothetical protein